MEKPEAVDGSSQAAAKEDQSRTSSSPTRTSDVAAIPVVDSTKTVAGLAVSPQIQPKTLPALKGSETASSGISQEGASTGVDGQEIPVASTTEQPSAPSDTCPNKDRPQPMEVKSTSKQESPG